MLTKDLASLLDRLENARRHFGPGQHQQIEALLERIWKKRFKNAETLISYHESLLFLEAYPQSAHIRQLVERELSSFVKRVEYLETIDADDLSDLDEPEVSGIGGRSVSDTFSYYIVRWLAERHPAQIAFDWDWFEGENRLGATWPRFMPLLEEDAEVEANVPYRAWLRNAKGRAKEVAWLIGRFESLPLSDKERAELYNSLQLFVRWTPSLGATRTGMNLRVPKIFYHRQPLIRRRDVSLSEEISATSPALKRLPAERGEAILDMARAASTIRYRELYGFTHGDARRVYRADLGRGVELFLTTAPPGARLPLRAYHAAMIFKNGVPVGYFEGLSLFERMESGFNLYYSFRDGETAWIYARTLNVFHKFLGVTTFALDPYQIGHENEEGIESGAFWFYRKLGFRPASPELLRLTLAEEKKIAARASYRTPKTKLRKLASGPMAFALDERNAGDWDRFQIRNLGMAVGRRMATAFKGDAQKMRAESVRRLAGALGIETSRWRPVEISSLSDFAIVLSLIGDLRDWTSEEKDHLVRIIRAKAGPDERRYLKLMQKHARLRAEMIRLGSVQK